jgi:flagellar protein FlaG
MSTVKIPESSLAVVAPRIAPKGEVETRATAERVSLEPETAAEDTARASELNASERARVAERLEKMAREAGRNLEFRVDEASEKMVIVVRDQSTGELIRQIPDATALRIAQRIDSQVKAMRSVLFEGRV